MPDRTITAVPGVDVGHHTDEDAATGVTVLTFPEPNTAVVDVRGGAPGTRETDALGPAIKPVTVNALMFAGGSAFGLAAAAGVSDEIEREGRGAPTPAGPVPIVPAAIVFDLMTGNPPGRPGPEDGAYAYRARSTEPVALGRVGAGAGTTVAAWRGPEAMQFAGIGSAAVKVGDAMVGALVVLNAAGDIFSLEGAALTGGEHASIAPPVGPPLPANTTLPWPPLSSVRMYGPWRPSTPMNSCRRKRPFARATPAWSRPRSPFTLAWTPCSSRATWANSPSRPRRIS